MPRIARVISETGIYHVMMRGNNGQEIFIDYNDKEKITKIIHSKAIIDGAIIYAYIIMDNHLHLVIREDIKPLSLTIKRIGIAYAQYFNKKYKKKGHVFQDRFKSEVIESDQYLLAAIRYVHLNPVKAGIGYLETYRWSSYRQYTCDTQATGNISKEILFMFSENRSKAINAFKKLHFDQNLEEFIDLPEDKKIPLEKVDPFIRSFLEEHCITREVLKNRENKATRELLVLELIKHTELSIREIAEFMNISRETARRASLSSEPSQ